MKKYDSLRTLFWALAAGLTTGVVSASTTITAQNADGDTLSVNSETYGDISNFTLTGDDIAAQTVGAVEVPIVLDPNGNNVTLTLDNGGAFEPDITFADDPGVMTLRFAPGSGQNITTTAAGSVTSTNPYDIMEVAGDGFTIFNSDLSGFQSHLKHTSGNLRITGNTDVMTSGGLISLESTDTAYFQGNGDIGTATSGTQIYVGSGTDVEFNDGTKTIYAQISGPGDINVTGGWQTFMGTPINIEGDLNVSGGLAVLAVSTDVNINTSSAGILGLMPESDATYSGNISHTSSSPFAIDSSGNVVTLSGTSSGTGPIEVTDGTLRLEDSAVFTGSAYSGSGTLHIDSTANKTLTGGLSGALSLKKSGSSDLTIDTADIDITGSVTIDGGKLITTHDHLGSNFTADTSDIAIGSGATMELDLNMSNGSPVTIAGRTFSGLGTLALDVAGASDTITLGGTSLDVRNITMTGTPTNSGGTFKLIFDGTIPTSDIERADAGHIVVFDGVTGAYDGGIDVVAGDTGAGLEVTGSSALTLTAAGAFNGSITADATSTVTLDEGAIKDDRVLTGAGTFVVNPSATHTFASDYWQGSGEINIQGGSSADTKITLSGAQSFTGTLELTDGYLELSALNALDDADAINIHNTSVLNLVGSNTQTLEDVTLQEYGSIQSTAPLVITNLVAGSGHENTSVVVGDTLTLYTTSNVQFSGALSSTNTSSTSSDGALIVEGGTNAVQTMLQMQGFERDITVRKRGLVIRSDINLGAYNNTYTMENEAQSLEFSFTKPTTASHCNIYLKGDSTFNSGSDIFFGLNGAHIQYHSDATGSTKTFDGIGGFSVGSNDLTLTADYGRSIIDNTAQGLHVDATNAHVVKNGFGDFEIRNALSTNRNGATTPAFVINSGALKLYSTSDTNDAISGNNSSGSLTTDFSIAAQAYLDFHVDDATLFSRDVGGEGTVRVYNSTGSQKNFTPVGNTFAAKGDYLIGDNVKFVLGTSGCEWYPGSASKIEISSNGGGLLLSGTIRPDGTHFNPYFTTPGGTIETGSTTTFEVGTGRDHLIIGNNSDTLYIQYSDTNVHFAPIAGTSIDFKYVLTSGNANADFWNTGAGTLKLESSDISGYYGIFKNDGAGTFIFKNKATADIHASARFDFGTGGGTTVFDTASVLELQSTNELFASASGHFAKKGTGSLVFDATANFETNSGDFNIYAGRSEWHQVERGTAHHTIVHRGAGLYVSREWNGHGGAIEVGHVELKSGSRLVLSEQVWDTPASAAANGDLMSVNISRLDAEAGSELVFHLNPNRAVTGADTPNLSAYAAPMTLAASFGSGTQTAPIYVRAVAVTTADLTANDIYPLIKFANTTDANALAGKIKVRPSIKGVQSSLYYMDSTYGGVDPALHTHYGQPYRYTDSNDSGEWLVLQVNDDQFAPGRLAAKTDFSSHAHPNGTYTVAYALMEQDFMAYSALDGLLAAINGHNRSLDYHLSLLQPSSYQSATVAFNQSSLLLQPLAEQGMAAIAEQQRWAQAVESDKLAGIYASLNAQQNLSSDTEVKAKGRTQSWTTSVQGLSFADETASHKVDAKVQGAALRLSSSLAVGYQHVAAQHAYAELSGQSSGSQNSHYGSGFVQMTAGDFAIAAQSTLGLHHNSHERVMNIDVAEGLTDNWVATSAYQSYEAQQEATVTYNSRISDKLSIGGGMKAVANARFTPEYAESGADNLNLVVEVQNHGYALATPMVSVDYRAAGKSGFMSSRLTAGYQAVVAQSNAVTYGLSDFEVRDEMRAEQPAAVSGWTAGYELGLMSQEGLSFQLRYNTVAAEQHQGQLSVSYDF